MASRSTHVFKTVDKLELKVDIYTRSSDPNPTPSDPERPVVLFLHGGGFVAFNRQHVPPHVVQSCLIRGWTLVSADYRLLPQVKGADILEDIKDAYNFVREKLPGILAGREGRTGPIENIIIVGQSAGAYLAYVGGLYLEPRPVAILTYYGFATTDEPHFSKGTMFGPTLVTLKEVEHYLKEPAHTSMTPSFNVFDPICLLPDLSRNPAYERPEVNFDNPADRRIAVLSWILQEDGLAAWFEGVDKSLDDVAWKNYPPTFVVHGDQDKAAPYEGSSKLVGVIGPNPVKLFTAEGQPHSFDQPLYLGDSGLAPVEKAWAALEDVVKSSSA